VPGLGHVYTERYKDGLVAFLLNGLFIWARSRLSTKTRKCSERFWGLSSWAFYTGTIYSAVNSAHKYNRKLKDDFLQDCLMLLISACSPPKKATSALP